MAAVTGLRVVAGRAAHRLRVCRRHGTLWDAATGAELAPTIYHLSPPRGENTWASVDHPNNRIVACGPDAWRSLGRVVPEAGTGMPEMLPAETFGALPVMGR